MDRRNFMQSMGLATMASALPGASLINALFIQNSYEMKALRGDIGIFTERGGTILWKLSDDGIAVVDTQFKPQAEHLIEAIKKKSDRQIDALINTHHHGDHSAGNIAFKGLIKNHFAHANCVKNMRATAEKNNALDNVLLPVANFNKKFAYKVAGEKIAMRYFGPAHTDGDAIIHFENANVAHMGDLLFNRRVPYIDKSTGASIANWQNVMDKAYKWFDDDTLLVFGHSGNGYEITGTRQDLKAFKNYLGKLLDYVDKGVKAGKSREALAETDLIPGADQWKGNQGRAVNAAYTEIVEEK
jgi:glyoxylase-like metal-dependent hydrolase (beta-lactamase superfamily II)